MSKTNYEVLSDEFCDEMYKASLAYRRHVLFRIHEAVLTAINKRDFIDAGCLIWGCKEDADTCGVLNYWKRSLDTIKKEQVRLVGFCLTAARDEQSEMLTKEVTADFVARLNAYDKPQGEGA